MEQNCNRIEFHAHHYMVLFPGKTLGGGGGVKQRCCTGGGGGGGGGGDKQSFIQGGST